MSGSRADFSGDAMFRIVQATRTVMETLGTPPVVVGGLAVMCRLQTAHRATLDLDVVDRRLREHAHLQILRRVDGAEDVAPSGVLLPTSAGQIKVDVLEVNQAEIDNPSDDPGDRLHAMAHAWAYDSATPVVIVAHGRDGEAVDVATLVSEPGPLVAMKLQAIMNRMNDKEGTDLLDILQLTLDGDCRRATVKQLRDRPDQMRDDIRRHVDLWFADRRAWSLQRISAVGGDADSEDLDLVHDILIDAVSA